MLTFLFKIVFVTNHPTIIFSFQSKTIDAPFTIKYSNNLRRSIYYSEIATETTTTLEILQIFTNRVFVVEIAENSHTLEFRESVNEELIFEIDNTIYTRNPRTVSTTTDF